MKLYEPEGYSGIWMGVCQQPEHVDGLMDGIY